MAFHTTGGGYRYFRGVVGERVRLTKDTTFRDGNGEAVWCELDWMRDTWLVKEVKHCHGSLYLDKLLVEKEGGGGGYYGIKEAWVDAADVYLTM